MEIQNLKGTAQRIKKAVKNNERIILYSDADLDGVASLIILEEAIKNLGGTVVLRYFPEREQEGYGLSEKALQFFKHFAPGLLILSDCGIGNFKEVSLANKMGFEVIIIDHHEILPQVPPALLIVDPKMQKDDLSLGLFAACGLCLKLAQLLLTAECSEKVEQGFFELAALGTLADMMPLWGENQIIAEKGISFLVKTQRIGLKVFGEFFDVVSLSARDLANKIITVLQLTDFIDHCTESYLLLNLSDQAEAKRFLSVLIEKSQQRKELAESLEKEMSEKVVDDSDFIFEGGPYVPHLLSGSLASRLCNKFKKPVFIFATKEDISQGSVRTPKDVNSVQAMSFCSRYLITYGGHPQAGGFSVKNKNLEKFKGCLLEYFKKK